MGFRLAQMAIQHPRCPARLLSTFSLKRKVKAKQSVQVSLKISTSSHLLQSSTDPDLDEIALYDRQIRLWGVKAQEK